MVVKVKRLGTREVLKSLKILRPETRGGGFVTVITLVPDKSITCGDTQQTLA